MYWNLSVESYKKWAILPVIGGGARQKDYPRTRDEASLTQRFPKPKFRSSIPFVTPARTMIRHSEVEARDQRLSFLTNEEIHHLTQLNTNGFHERFRRCCLGILHAGTDTDNTADLLKRYPDFKVAIARCKQGIKFVLDDAPRSAFIDGERIHESMRDHLCSAATDLIFHAKHIGKPHTAEEITDAVFHMLRHSGVFDRIAPAHEPRTLASATHKELTRITAWGGHSISDSEYRYTKEVGTRFGERFCEFITGGGGGAMRGPMSGANAAYTAERIRHARMFGFSCPGIITSEPPNLFVNPLVILPDIEKRLEAFVRSSMGCVVFMGGPGTAEEIQTILSILLDEKNREQSYPVILTGPESARSYFEAIENFLLKTIGTQAIYEPKPLYDIIIGDPERVAQRMMEHVKNARQCRREHEDTDLWYGSLHIPEEVQQPFNPTHEAVAQLEITRDQPPARLCAQLRRLFSAVVHGNVTDDGARRIREFGPYEFRGDPMIMAEVDALLARFVAEGRMKLEGEYKPCYRVIR